MEIQSAIQEERQRLEETLAEIDAQLAAIGPRYYGDDYVEQVLDARREETRRRLELLAAEPYFGRLDFEEDRKHGRSSGNGKAGSGGRAGENGKEDGNGSGGRADQAAEAGPVPLYIGKRGMERRGTMEPYVIDWRAPAASLFYSFTGGEEAVEYESPDGPVSGYVHRKRNVAIRERELQRVTDSYVRGGDNMGLSDEFLLYRLGERKDNKLRDIVSTIQAEQDAIIRAPKSRAMVIQGAAGSGKTTVALHRLAYLLYRYQEQMRAERMIIFAPNAMFLDYISGVLPELGVGNVKQTTFADWAQELVPELKLAEDDDAGRWFRLAGQRPPIHALTPGRFKGSLAYKHWIDEGLRRFEETFVPEAAFEPWEGMTLPYETIRDWFHVEYKHEPLAKRSQRLIARMTRWLDMRLTEIGDPNRRKERSKAGKAKLRAYAGKLPDTGALAFYRRLFIGEGKRGSSAQAPAAGRIPRAIAEAAAADVKRGVVREEDLPAVIWIHRKLHGAAGGTFDHVVIDEAQDVSPFHVELLRAFMHEPSFTILGDLAQGIHSYRGVHRWEELTSLFAEEYRAYHTLRLSYRSTLEIIAYANLFLRKTETGLPDAEPVFRSGEPVETAGLAGEDEQAERVRAFVEASRERRMATVAVIGRTPEGCRDMAERLSAAGFDARLIEEGQRGYAGGVSVVPVHLAKGLEFDAVVLFDADARHYADTPEDAKLLYVGCTRALHRLAVLYTGEPSPLLASAESE